MQETKYLLFIYCIAYFNNEIANSFTPTYKRFQITHKSSTSFTRKDLKILVSNEKNPYDDVIPKLSFQINPLKKIKLNAKVHRRKFIRLTSSFLSTLEYLSTDPGKANAIGFESNDALNDKNLNCLLDLPPVEEGYVRVYICRHGQTEYNRLRLVQGSRVDPSLNDTGMSQAKRIGLALSRLPSPVSPKTSFYSALRRSKETATIASRTMVQNRGENTNSFIPLNKIQDLNEVDFGNLEGMAVAESRALMTKSYVAWSIGLLDQTFMKNGENGLDILHRIKNALKFISDHGKANGQKPILAVSHGAYLRLLLCICLDKSLAESATLTQKNGCINVIDVNVNGEEVSPSTLFTTPLSRVFMKKHAEIFTFPKVKVIRIDESRHLYGLI